MHKLICSLTLLLLITMSAFAQRYELQYMGNASSAEFEKVRARMLSYTDPPYRPTKAPKDVFKKLNIELNQYDLSNGDIFMFSYEVSSKKGYTTILRITNAKTSEYEYYAFILEVD